MAADGRNVMSHRRRCSVQVFYKTLDQFTFGVLLNEPNCLEKSKGFQLESFS